LRVIERGPFYRILEQVTPTIDEVTGEASAKTSRYTEMADGMHYWDGQWKESQDLIEIAGDHAIARFGQAKVIFGPSLDAPGAIDLTSVSGQRFRSAPLGIYYFDS
jgi:hypothetical protein